MVDLNLNSPTYEAILASAALIYHLHSIMRLQIQVKTQGRKFCDLRGRLMQASTGAGGELAASAAEGASAAYGDFCQPSKQP